MSFVILMVTLLAGDVIKWVDLFPELHCTYRQSFCSYIYTQCFNKRGVAPYAI